MRGDGSQLRQGLIVWIEVSDPRGHVKKRPVVVISADEDVLLDKPIFGVAVTTTYSEPPPANCVPLPWNVRGHPATRLRRRSAAVCDWLVSFRPSEVATLEGYVPARTLQAILRTVRDLNPG